MVPEVLSSQLRLMLTGNSSCNETITFILKYLENIEKEVKWHKIENFSCEINSKKQSKYLRDIFSLMSGDVIDHEK